MTFKLKLLPLILLFNHSSVKAIIEEDINRWTQQVAPSQLERKVFEKLALLLDMPYIQEFRNMFYYRIGVPPGVWDRFLLALARFLYKPRDSLYIDTSLIGPGALIFHGVGTVIQAERVGKHCMILHEVVIGPKMDYADGRPIIGDYVRISAGAKILGPVTIGDHSIIGANAVVTKDIPSKCMAIGVPARIIPMERHTREKQLS